ncbi:hypothetical protein BESB_036320 [Besnoitia besnoiti]|uniref:Uncharacterized protein n=1 Tax=Besnoitia besnoiti TaxID=94643 RepID=A0A2A9MJ03_BESBE|nr:hypothetical protein BESB_036320 [Besnoitia besnoiti]PFH37174.1 hypothetical protein BESB_036320 [Besnoitia besnoiti]
MKLLSALIASSGCLLPVAAVTSVVEESDVPYSAPLRHMPEMAYDSDEVDVQSFVSEETIDYDIDASLRHLEEIPIQETFDSAEERYLGKKKQEPVVVAAPAKKVAPVKKPVVETKYVAPVQTKYVAPVETKYAAPTKKWRRLADVSETTVSVAAQATEDSDISAVTMTQTEEDEDRDLKKKRAYVVPAVAPAVHCAVGNPCYDPYHAGCEGSACLRYMGETEMTEDTVDQSAEERSLGKKKQETVVAAPAKKVAPVKKPVVETKYVAPVQTKYAPPTKKWRRLAALAATKQAEDDSVASQTLEAGADETMTQADDVMTVQSEESAVSHMIEDSTSTQSTELLEESAGVQGVSATESETEDERDLKKKATTYVVPVVQKAPACVSGKSCSSYHSGCVGNACTRYMHETAE